MKTFSHPSRSQPFSFIHLCKAVSITFPKLSSLNSHTHSCLSHSDGKYHLLPSGELLVHNLDNSDRYASYRCRTMHKLTRQVVISNAAKIRLNGKANYNFCASFACQISNFIISPHFYRTSRHNLAEYCRPLRLSLCCTRLVWAHKFRKLQNISLSLTQMWMTF